MSGAPDEEPKIIIDEDWKGRVEREREESLQQAEKAGASEEAGAPEEGEEGSLLEQLVSGLAAQTLLALGLVAEQNQQEVMVDMPTAKHVIDTLMMLRDKTKGNLTPQEEQVFREALSELQRLYAARAQQVQQAAMHGATADPGAPPRAR